ncbi:MULTISPECIES: hypothetical protein [unclassified Pedobacter]|uniref:hypothetical protein n=1 Tax=unclassified Pedobacter TaxID=2628915 RepID=UPI00141D7EBC|nr:MULTISPECIES: hypothetical protein [unclassified Pedobacter]NII83992.1 hypothetical protein [Pedobacter sp. SG908]NMN37866.1 hypothetical protein [Pedobacter sp. SG918]
MKKSISSFFVSTCFIVLGISFIFNACKKDKILEDPITSAKDWYLKSNANKGTVLQSNKGTSQQIKEEVDWNTARTFQLDDGTDVIGVLVKMKLGEGELGGSYMLLIHKNKNNYQVQVAYNPEKGYFEGYMSDRGMIALYKQTLDINNKKPLKGVNKNKLMAITCTNWYLVTTYYDGYGNTTGSSSQFLYTSCSGNLGDYPEPDHGGPVDCAGTLAGGAYLSDCGCIGGQTGIAACPLIIRTDSSITNNPKAKCALEKLLRNNTKFDSLINAFTGQTYNLKFQVKTLAGSKRAETTWDAYNHQNFEINLNRSFINSNAPVLQVAKTLLHEAFHANLMQRAYLIFGASEINSNWVKKPENMDLNELIDIFESKLSGTSIETIHHEYMAKNINVIAAGLNEFAQKYDSNYSNYDQYDYLGLAWEGLRETNYFIQNVKNTQVYYVPGTTIHLRIDSLFDNKVTPMLNNSNVNCIN